MNKNKKKWKIMSIKKANDLEFSPLFHSVSKLNAFRKLALANTIFLKPQHVISVKIRTTEWKLRPAVFWKWDWEKLRCLPMKEVCIIDIQKADLTEMPQWAVVWAMFQHGRDNVSDGKAEERLMNYWAAACSRILGLRISWPQHLQKTDWNTANM